jgi:PGF-pre-PGF domain-containing protein
MMRVPTVNRKTKTFFLKAFNVFLIMLMLLSVFTFIIDEVEGSNGGKVFKEGQEAKGQGYGDDEEDKVLEVYPSSSSVEEGEQFTVQVKCEGEDIAGAAVIFNEETQDTNSNGQVTFTAPDIGEYSFKHFIITASHEDYESGYSSIEVVNPDPDEGDPSPDGEEGEDLGDLPHAFDLLYVDNDDTVYVGDPFDVEVTIHDGSPVEGARVTFNEEPRYTDRFGRVVFIAPLYPGEKEHPIIASKEGYADGTSSIDVIRMEKEDLEAGDTLEAVINGPSKGIAGETLSFKAYHAPESRKIVAYTWIVDDDIYNGNEISILFSEEGTYIITLTITDDTGDRASDSKTVTIEEEGGRSVGIIADAGSDQNVLIGEEIRFSGSASGGVEPYTWFWEFGDGSTSTQQNPQHTYSSTGRYTATLTVTDSNGDSDSDGCIIIIEDIGTTHYTIAISTVGLGSISKSPELPFYPGGESIKLTASPGEGYEFEKWVLSFGGPSLAFVDETITFVINDDVAGSAYFNELEIEEEEALEEEFIEEAEFGELEEGVLEINPEDRGNNIIYKVELKPIDFIQFVRFQETLLKKCPKDITASPFDKIHKDVVVHYLDLKLFIDEEYIKESDIEFLIFYYRVKKDKLDKLDIEKTSLVLMRYHEGEWHILNNMYLTEDDEYVYYSAESPGCSTFAIVGSKVVEKGEAFKTNEPDIPWVFILLFVVILTVVLVVVLFKARFVYIDKDEDLEEKKKKEPSKKPSLATVNTYLQVDVEN